MKFEGDKTKVWEDRANNIIRVHSYPGVYVDVDDAMFQKHAIEQINSENKLSVLVDMRKVKGVSGEARTVFQTIDRATAIALIVQSPMSKLIGSFFIGLNKGVVPIKLFTDENYAIEWLKEQK